MAQGFSPVNVAQGLSPVNVAQGFSPARKASGGPLAEVVHPRRPRPRRGSSGGSLLAEVVRVTPNESGIVRADAPEAA